MYNDEGMMRKYCYVICRANVAARRGRLCRGSFEVYVIRLLEAGLID